MKKIIFLLFLIGLLAGGGAYLYFTDFNIVKKYVTPHIPESVMSKVPAVIADKITESTSVSTDNISTLELAVNKETEKYDTQHVSNDNPVFNAFRKGSKEDILKAIDEAPSVDIFDVTGRTPLMYSAFRDDTAVAEKVLSKGADVNFKDRWGHTALMYAAKYGNKNMVDYLISKGADINVVGTDGETPVSAAAFDGSVEILSKFIDSGADIDIKDDYGNTPLMKAAINGNKRALTLLIEYGADLNSKNADGLTATMLACESGRYETAKALLDAGADVQLKDNAGENALDHAEKFGHNHIVSLLRQYVVMDGNQNQNNIAGTDNSTNVIMH